MDETTPLPERHQRLKQEVLALKQDNEALRQELAGLTQEAEALRINDARFLGLSSVSFDWFWEQDKDLRFVQFFGGVGAGPLRGEHVAWLGKRRWELPGLVPIGQSWEEHQQELLAHKVFRNFRYSRSMGGQLRYVAASGAPYYDKDGAFAGYRGTSRDVTEAMRGEASQLAGMQLLHDILESIPIAVQLKSVKNGFPIEMWNKAAEALYGIPRSEAIGKTVHDLWPAESARWMQSADEELVASRGAQDFPAREAPTRDRGTVTVNMRKRLLYDASGEVNYLMVVAEDITLRLEAENRIRQSEERFRRLTALSADWYWEQDKDLRFIDTWAGNFSTSHLERTLSLGQQRWEIEGLLEGPEFWQSHKEQLERRERFINFEYERRDEHGKILAVSISGEPIFNEAGEFTGYRGVGTNITARRQTEATLRASEIRFRTVVAALVEAVVLRDLDANIVDCNPSAERLVGKTLAEMKGKRYLDESWKLSREDGTPLPEHERPATVARRSGQSQSDVIRIEKIDGSVFWMLTNIRPLYHGPAGELSGFVTTITDITEHKRWEREIIKLNVELESRVLQRTAQLEAANKELEAFSYSVAHDLRSPLNAIDGFSALLQKAVLQGAGTTERADHYLSRIRAGVRQMGELTDGLLTLAQLSRASLRNEHVDLNAIARDIFVALRERDPARDAQLDAQAGLSAVGDPSLLRQVLENLIGNAWKFSARQSRSDIAVGKQVTATGQDVFFVKDNGAGFDMAYADKLFGTFQRLHSPGEFAGSGIGLATVHRIVARHQGRIWAESEPGGGARFYFTLSREL